MTTEISADMLVKLYDLTEDAALDQQLRERSITVRRAYAPEKHIVVQWMATNFRKAWGSESDVAFSGHPVKCIIATHQGTLIGACIYDSIALGVCGPIAVDKRYGGQGVGKAILRGALLAMRNQGYAYAVLGWAGPAKQPFFHKAVPAEVIANSRPEAGMYRDLLTD